MKRQSRVFALARQLFVTVALGICLNGCAVGTLTTASTGPASYHLHQSYLAQAATISKSAWDGVRSSGSKFGAWATILMEGRNESDPSVLAASSNAKSPAASYLALKAEDGATPPQQLAAVVADVNDKTAQVDAFIGFAKALAADYRQRLATLEITPNARRAEQHREAIESDRRVLDHAVAELRSQKTTYEAVERKLKDGSPALDTAMLTRALSALNQRIERLVALARTMDAQTTG